MPMYFRCPSCTHLESNVCKVFRLGDLEKKQKCNACRKSNTVSRWKCVCNTYWHKCLQHRHCWSADMKHAEKPARPRAEPQTADTSAKRPKVYGANVYEVMLKEDHDRAKRKLQETCEWTSEPTFILGTPRIRSIKVSSLCPPLKKRFIHPGGE